MHPKLLRPRRARLAEALAVVGGCGDAASAWESLAAAGLIPMEWIHHASRSYLVHSAGGARRSYYPPTLEFCALLAADAPSVQAAELIARESLREVRDRDAVLWRLVDGAHVEGERLEFDRCLREGRVAVPEQLLETGFVVDVVRNDRVALLMPGEELADPAQGVAPPRF